MSDPVIVAELRRIADAHDGILRAADVVAAARPEVSPLHHSFDWDDSEAAEKWRLQQARNLIRVTVEHVGVSEQKVTTRVFVSLTPDREQDGGGYRAMAAVMSNAEYRRQLMADAEAEMKSFEKKYAELQELTEVFAAMRKARKAKTLEERMPWPDLSVNPEDAMRKRVAS